MLIHPSNPGAFAGRRRRYTLRHRNILHRILLGRKGDVRTEGRFLWPSPPWLLEYLLLVWRFSHFDRRHASCHRRLEPSTCPHIVIDVSEGQRQPLNPAVAEVLDVFDSLKALPTEEISASIVPRVGMSERYVIESWF